MNDIDIRNSCKKLLSYIEKEHFCGYDPYDLLSTPLPTHLLWQKVQAAIMQMGKLMPINIRPLLGVKKFFDPKGAGLLLSAYCKLYTLHKEERYLNAAKTLYDGLKANRSPGYEEYCWGHPFRCAGLKETVAEMMPSSVATSFVCQGIYDYYGVTKDQEAADIIGSASQYILNRLKQTKTNEGICLSYTEQGGDCCYNSTLLSAELLSMYYALTADKRYLDLINEIVSFVLAHQYDDGHWEYSINMETGKERHQVDFHQGFILCSLYRIYKNIGELPAEVSDAIRKGLRFYKEQQFTDYGRSLWRLPKEFPIDIHNQSQGIITFCMLSKFDESFKPFARNIMEWTIEHMQSSKGYFYYRIFKHYTIRTPFMRWSQAWMLLANSYLASPQDDIETH